MQTRPGCVAHYVKTQKASCKQGRAVLLTMSKHRRRRANKAGLCCSLCQNTEGVVQTRPGCVAHYVKTQKASCKQGRAVLLTMSKHRRRRANKAGLCCGAYRPTYRLGLSEIKPEAGRSNGSIDEPPTRKSLRQADRFIVLR